MIKEPEIQEVSGDENEPLTKGEFNEAIQMLARSFEATKADMDATEERLTRAIDRIGREIMEHIDLAVENRQIDLGAAKKETVLHHGEKLADHEARLGVLEKFQGVPKRF